MKLNGYNKRAASNTAKHKENNVYSTISFLHNATMAPGWDVDNMIRYFSDEHEGKSLRDGGKNWTAVLKKNVQAPPA